MDSTDISPTDVADENSKDNDVSSQATDLQVTETMMKEYTSMKKSEAKKKKNEVKKKKNEAKKKIEKKKYITPVSSPEFIHVPSTAEKRRDAKVARNCGKK